MWKRGLALGMLALLLAQTTAPGRTRLQAAEAVARWRWGNVCDGQVTVFNRPLKDYIAIATWNRPHRDCTITYSTTYPWAWWSLCAATAHEYGHLAGYRSRHPYVDDRGRADWMHSRFSGSLMFPFTWKPYGPCGPDHNHPRLYRARG